MNTFVDNNFTISIHETMNPFFVHVLIISRKINKAQQNALVFITHLLPLRIVMVNI